MKGLTLIYLSICCSIVASEYMDQLIKHTEILGGFKTKSLNIDARHIRYFRNFISKFAIGTVSNNFFEESGQLTILNEMALDYIDHYSKFVLPKHCLILLLNSTTEK